MTAPSAMPRDPQPLRVPPAQVHIPASDREEILRRIDAAMASGQLTLGAIGRELEERFAAHHGARHAIAVNSGTSAIEIPLRALDVTDKEVLVPANTFFATAAAVIAAGARPRFVDCDPATMAVDLESVRASIGPETAGVVVVHIGGLVTPAIHELRALCDEHGIFLFEDAAR
jgi:dTDP-4-amino-4,6-dideoxygalactose transaminase